MLATKISCTYSQLNDLWLLMQLHVHIRSKINNNVVKWVP